MTPTELDEVLASLGLNLESESGRGAKDRILEGYGRSLAAAASERCSHCWTRDNNKKKNGGAGMRPCPPSCPGVWIPKCKSPIDVAVRTLSSPNDVDAMAFVVQFVVPVYEQDTGRTGTMERAAAEYQRRWRAEKSQNGPSDFGQNS